MSRHPPVTPSPHRFLAGKQKSPPPGDDANSGADVRKDATTCQTSSTNRVPTFQSSSKFAATPRFSFSRPKPSSRKLRSPSPPRPVAVQSFRAVSRSADEVEDAGSQTQDEYLSDADEVSALPTTERNESQQWMNDVAFSPKRRRLHENDTSLSPTRPTFKYPGVPASESTRATPSFTSSRQQSTEASTSDAGHIHRPAFIRPAVEPQEQHEPLPETFSPHKRGDRFVPGGMAATAQQWVIETGQAAVQSRKGQGYLKGEDYVLRAKVASYVGDGPTTLLATLPGGDIVHLLLAANRSANAAQSAQVMEGCVVGIRAPTWEIELYGRMWTVAVDWKMVS